jgi:CRISPR type III-B/RAMP module RAMP protein Cmr6
MTERARAMAISLQNHTRQALGGVSLPGCESRALFAARFADPAAEKDTRKAWFKSFIAKHAAAEFPATGWLPANAEVIHARLMSRLMVDLAGGVMENANLNLNRYGLPVIPGSAVKGCARRMALQALHDWSAYPNTPDDPTLPCRESFSTPAEMLAATARIFGWVEQDWCDRSDFFWAANRDTQVLNDAKAALPPHNDFAGTIAFLPATPNRDPGLELDVVTPHHTAYYEGNNPGAPDTEDPVPVYFPAVKPQAGNQHFTFPLIPLARAEEGDLQLAKTFLSHGLELLGVGAKTHAGYGWFEMLTTAAIPVNQGDYANDTIFNNSVVGLLNQPGKYESLKKEVEKLQKPENAKWLVKLREALRGDDMKKTRKNLREKDWFPKNWLEKPQP